MRGFLRRVKLLSVEAAEHQESFLKGRVSLPMLVEEDLQDLGGKVEIPLADQLPGQGELGFRLQSAHVLPPVFPESLRCSAREFSHEKPDSFLVVLLCSLSRPHPALCPGKAQMKIRVIRFRGEDFFQCLDPLPETDGPLDIFLCHMEVLIPSGLGAVVQKPACQHTHEESPNVRPEGDTQVRISKGSHTSYQVLEEPVTEDSNGIDRNSFGDEEAQGGDEELHLGVVQAVDVNPHDPGDSARGAEARPEEKVRLKESFHAPVDERGGHSRHEIEKEVFPPADLVLHVDTEHPEEQEVSEKVKEICVKEHGGYPLPGAAVNRNEEEAVPESVQPVGIKDEPMDEHQGVCRQEADGGPRCPLQF